MNKNNSYNRSLQIIDDVCPTDDCPVMISVVLPTYNRIKTLPRAIRCVLNQTYTNHELIVIDDGSTDNSHEMVCRQYPNIKYLRINKNKGVSNARNVGIKFSKGEFIAFLDSDDEWHPDYLKFQAACLMSRRNISLSFVTPLKGQSESKKNTLRCLSQATDSNDLITHMYQAHSFIDSMSMVIIRRSCLSSVDLFDIKLNGPEDRDMYIRLLKSQVN